MPLFLGFTGKSGVLKTKGSQNHQLIKTINNYD
jgi:hypothetical protein